MCKAGSLRRPPLLSLGLDVLYDLFSERVPLLGPQVEQFPFQVAQVAPGLGALHARDPGLEASLEPQVRGVPLQGRQIGRADHQAHLAGRIYRPFEADPVTRHAGSGRRVTRAQAAEPQAGTDRGPGMRLLSRLNVRFGPDYVRFTPKSGRKWARRWESAFDPQRKSRFTNS